MLSGLLSLTLAAAAAGEIVSIGRVGLWPVALFVGYLLTLQQTRRFRRRSQWQINQSDEEQEALRHHDEEDERKQSEARNRRGRMSNMRLYGGFAIFSVIVLIGGWAVARLGSALAEQTGLGQSFVGATLVAMATSLPELSTTIRSAQLGNYAMAISNIFGSNAFMIGLFVVAELAYGEGPVMNSLDRSSQFAAALGIVVTCIFLWGLLERRDKTVLRMGIDSGLVLVVYLGGLIVLYSLRNS